MKNKIISTILIIAIIMSGFLFMSIYIDYLKESYKLNKELGNANTKIGSAPEETDSLMESIETIQVDEDSTIKIVKKFDKSMFEGKKSLVFFWASWCPHCQEEYDVIKTAISDYQNRGFNIYIISHDYKTTELSDFMKNNDLNYDVYFDEQRIIRAHFDPTASSVPLTYIIDENANLIATHDGAITIEELNNLIDKNM